MSPEKTKKIFLFDIFTKLPCIQAKQDSVVLKFHLLENLSYDLFLFF
jgi:hypothetical protein